MLKSRIVVEADEHKLDALFAHLNQCHLPGAAVGIAKDGKPIYRKAFGMASSELPVRLSPSIRMRIGSITKHFASLAYLLLCERGKARLDDPIGRYLPEIHPVSRGATMRQLMGHVSGVRDATDVCWQFSGRGQRVSSSEMLSLYGTIDDVNATPGTSWIYGNGGYLMLSSAIERITDKPLEDVLRESIFKPVGMYDTALRRFDTDFMPNSATLHTPKSDNTFEKSYLGTALAGEGGMVSTVNDMLHWLHHMSAPEIGTSETWLVMKRAQVLANGTSTSYGLGLESGRYRDLETVGHSGSVMGGTADMLKVVPLELDVVVLVNRGDVMAPALTRGLLDACLTSRQPEELGEQPLTTGTFLSRRTGRVIELFAQSGQQVASIDGADIPVQPASDGVLHPSPVYGLLKYSFTLIGGAKAPIKMLFNEFGHADELVAVSPAGAADAQSIAGRYRSDSTGTEVTIRPTGDGASLKSIGQFGSSEYALRSLTEGIWRSSSGECVPWGGMLTFDPGNSAFRFSNLRNRALLFRRVH